MSNQLMLYAAKSNGDHVRAGLHRSAGARGYALTGNHDWADDSTWGTGVSHLHYFDNGDDVLLTLTRTGGKWQLTWENLDQDNTQANPLADGASGQYDFPWLDNEDLYVGVHYANPRTETNYTTDIDYFEVDVVPTPTSLVGLIGMGAVGLVFAGWRSLKSR